MGYQVTVRQHFDAAHYLRGYQGKCENVHGHRFEVVVTLEAEKLNELGLAYDFVELKRHLEDLLAKWDHTCLNEVPPFNRLNPSSENIAATLYAELQRRLEGAPATLASVQVWESPSSGVTYLPSRG
jgi:6-pyruvoyltetrahydropterin/6-carboxytetrahydropterin synthase